MTCPKCSETTYTEGNFCRKCGAAMVDTAATTLPITEPAGQVSMDERDIIIEIKSKLNREIKKLNQEKGISFVIIYDDVDRECKLPHGSTIQYIKQAAQECDLEIDEGPTRAELRLTAKTTKRRIFGQSRL